MSSSPPSYGDPETRRRILDATWELFDERGSGVRVADAAARAGVSRQAVYLHFGDRSGLLVALGDHMDQSFGRDRLRTHVFGAPSGVEGLRRWIETMSTYTAKIDSISRVIETGQYEDEGLAAVWRDRMNGRRGHIRRISERIAAEGRLAEGWTIDTAVDLIYVVTMPGPWRELTRELGWSPERYAEDVTKLLTRSLLTPTGFAETSALDTESSAP